MLHVGGALHKPVPWIFRLCSDEQGLSQGVAATVLVIVFGYPFGLDLVLNFREKSHSA